MKIIAITMVKNEMDVIESFVRHTLTFADELIVCEHQSSDATREILEKLQAEGLPVELQTEYNAAYEQAEVMCRLLAEAAARGADLILPLDADEFLLPKAPGDVRAILETLSPERVYHLCWRFTAPTGGAEDTFLLARPLCHERQIGTGYKCLVGGAIARRLQLKLVQGNHTAYAEENGHRCTILDEPCGLYLAHFFWRSPEQWQSKALVTWVNIAAQFSIDAYPAGGYLSYAMDVCDGRGKTLADVIPDAVPCDLTGYARPQVLRYSGTAHINVLHNLAAAATALAENCAVLCAEQTKPRVTSVVPYLGDEEAFRTSLASVRDEVFPRHQILIPVIAGALSEPLSSELDAFAQIDTVRVIQRTDKCPTGGVLYDALATEATGDFVEWVLPGEQVRPEKLRAMVTSLILNPVPFALLISTLPAGAHPKASPFVDFALTSFQNIMRMPRMGFYQMLLTLGAVPSGGMSAVLMRRSLLDACGWLRGCFADGRPHYLAIYRALLTAATVDGKNEVGLLHHTYQYPAREPDLSGRAAHQLDLHHFLQQDASLFAPGQRADAADQLRRHGIDLLTQALEAGEDTSRPVWQAYQSMLQAL